MTSPATPYIADCTAGWNPADLDRITDLALGGHLLVVPTDTVYGIGALASDPQAVAAVLAAKGRGRQMPPPVLVASPEDMVSLCAEVPPAAQRLAAAHWPGGLTLILRARPDLGWDLGDTGGTLALRMPDHPIALELLARTGPLAVTSANLTGAPPATDIHKAVADFGPKVAAYIDGGPTPGPTASTILDLSRDSVRAIRLGTISLEELSATCGCPIPDPAA